MRGQFTGDGTGLVGLVSGQEKVDSQWAVGGRFGWLVNPNTLTYVSGGYTEAHRTGVGNYIDRFGVATGVSLPGSTRQGWFIGSGIEYNMGWLPGLTWKTEYRYSEYDSVDNFERVIATGALTNNFSRDKLITQTVLTSLVWRFNWGGVGKSPVVAKY